MTALLEQLVITPISEVQHQVRMVFDIRQTVVISPAKTGLVKKFLAKAENKFFVYDYVSSLTIKTSQGKRTYTYKMVLPG